MALASERSAKERVASFLYLPIALSGAVKFSIRRKRFDLQDLRVLLFLTWSPLPFLLGFKGRVRGPFGEIVVESRDKLKSAAYGAFKTNFCYLRTLRQIYPKKGKFNVVVDVGACVGDLPMAISNISRRMVAIEPGRTNFAALKANITRNRIENVELINMAAHSAIGTVALGGIDSNRRVLSSLEGETVGGIPLDELIDQLGIQQIDFLKIDVQGHEMHVLRGSQELLEKKRIELLCVEAHEALGISPGEINRLLKSHGYVKVLDNEYLFKQRQLYFVPDGHLNESP